MAHAREGCGHSYGASETFETRSGWGEADDAGDVKSVCYADIYKISREVEQ
jgi:hypothetical protein